MTAARATLGTVDVHLSDRAPFVCNRNLHSASRSEGVGELSEALHALLRAAERSDDFYVVYSYATPIAWYANSEWTVPAIRYSQSTTRHQNIIRNTVRVTHEPSVPKR